MTNPESQNQDEEPLKSCPFCGLEARLSKCQGEWSVRCVKLGTCMGSLESGFTYKSDAIRVWNLRDDTALAAERQRSAELEKRVELFQNERDIYMNEGFSQLPKEAKP